jgi:hypothetical protein
MACNALAVKCVKPKPKWAPGKDWISKETWRLIAKQASIWWSEVSSAKKVDKRKLTANVGNSIVVELANSTIKEAFRHLKG